MTDFENVIKALRLAWISRLLCTGHQNWKSVPTHFFVQYGGLEFVLKGTLSRGFLRFGVKNVLKCKSNAFFPYTECS